MSDYRKEIMEEFNEKFCNVYGGDSGLGGNDPQEPVDEWATDNPSDVRQWLSQALTRVEETGYQEGIKQVRYGNAGRCPRHDEVLRCLGCVEELTPSEEVLRCLGCVEELTPSEEKEIFEGIAKKTEEPDVDFITEKEWYCTKHQLNHGQKYKSCSPKKEGK